MFTSDTEKTGTEKKVRRNALILFECMIFSVVFSSVYTSFGHGVNSFFMSSLFIWPLAGVVWCVICLVLRKIPSRFSRNAMNAGIATITAGSLLKGIFEIAGTSSIYENLFFLFGAILIGIGIVSCVWSSKRTPEEKAVHPR